jgi:ATP-dependent RNA helicase SUPV3L1/SUV3
VAIDHVEGVSDNYWQATGYRRIGGRVMRVDMAERLAAVIRTESRKGIFRITEEMLSLAGATRDQMQIMIEDLGFVTAGEEASEDPEKPAIILFERPAKPRRNPAKPASGDAAKANANAKNVGAHKKGNGNGKGKSDKAPASKSSTKSKSPAPKPLDPNSPFAILAKLKSK